MESCEPAGLSLRGQADVEASTSHPFKLVSTLDGPPAEANEVEAAWHGHGVPSDALDLWAACRQARLFKGVEYGQWGLALPATSTGSPDEGPSPKTVEAR